MKKPVSYTPDTASLLHRRRRIFLLGLIFLLFLASGISVIRHSSFLSLFGFSSPQNQENDADIDDTNVDFLTVAAPASEDSDSSKFRSGGLGLTRTSWEVLHGIPEAADPVSVVYQEKTYTVTYQQDLVWQIEKSWGATPPAPQQARTRIRRYLPLDSHLVQTIKKSDDTIVDVYRSHMLAQLLSPQPIERPSKKKVKRKQKDLPTESCVVVHWLTKQKVTSSLLHIGAPKAEGYLPPQSQTVPTKTSTKERSTRSEAGKTATSKEKGRTQGRS